MSMTEKLAYIKKLRHLTTEEIAQQSGVPLGTLNKIFSGSAPPRTMGFYCSPQRKFNFS